MIPGGVVVRLNKAELKTEWLTPEGAWSDRSIDALFFPLFDGDGSATVMAVRLSAEHGEYIFPAVRSKPMPFREEQPCGDEFANTEPEPVSTSLAVAKRAASDTFNGSSTVSSPAQRPPKRSKPKSTAVDRGKGLRDAHRRVSSAEESAAPTGDKFWWREGQFA